MNPLIAEEVARAMIADRLRAAAGNGVSGRRRPWRRRAGLSMVRAGLRVAGLRGEVVFAPRAQSR